MAPDEFKSTVDVWADILGEEVPEDEIITCYKDAILIPRRLGFPIGVSEVLDAHRRRQGLKSHKRYECDFCRLHKEAPAVYAACRFHSEGGQS